MVLLSLVFRNAGPPYLVVVVFCCFFFCRFQLFCISLLLISNRVLWGLFSSGLSLCDDFRKKKWVSYYPAFLDISKHSQGDSYEDKVPCLCPWYLDY